MNSFEGQLVYVYMYLLFLQLHYFENDVTLKSHKQGLITRNAWQHIKISLTQV